MRNRKKTPTEIFSGTVIGLSLALLSGMGLGDLTRQSMHARLSASPPADPVERYALGQNAYKTPRITARKANAQSADYADASYEIGRYENGARILMPEEPARRADRLRMERLQDWNEQSFGQTLDDEPLDYAALDSADYAPIDVGAVMPVPESGDRPAVRQISATSSRMKAEPITLNASAVRSAPAQLIRTGS
tara:strand:+ start:11704 stop:12282 length:579 start_codon:yes stop_codon:yes gene_type:complete